MKLKILSPLFKLASETVINIQLSPLFIIATLKIVQLFTVLFYCAIFYMEFTISSN